VRFSWAIARQLAVDRNDDLLPHCGCRRCWTGGGADAPRTQREQAVRDALQPVTPVDPACARASRARDAWGVQQHNGGTALPGRSRSADTIRRAVVAHRIETSRNRIRPGTAAICGRSAVIGHVGKIRTQASANAAARLLLVKEASIMQRTWPGSC